LTQYNFPLSNCNTKKKVLWSNHIRSLFKLFTTTTTIITEGNFHVRL
jgi:hypothetical protein